MSLVQRDSIKQIIEEMTVEMEHLKSEIKNQENTLAEHEQKLRQFSTYSDRLEVLESESLLLKKHLASFAGANIFFETDFESVRKD